ncbi:MAG: hypothetical protein P4L40_18550 [Terracidiphilus sp.]|nr:hypothetical protein [Terracidiphilus sp.]
MCVCVCVCLFLCAMTQVQTDRLSEKEAQLTDAQRQASMARGALAAVNDELTSLRDRAGMASCVYVCCLCCLQCHVVCGASPVLLTRAFERVLL